MRYLIIPFIFFFLIRNTFAQRNCNVYLWDGDSCRYQACTFLENAPNYFQLTKEFHEVYDSVLSICPEYSDAYRAKSVAYLKTGNFIQWKLFMDKAVEINPKDHLGYRGWCRFQFLRDYEGALDDFDRLEKLTGPNVGYSQNGMYHLTVVKALCYKMLNQEKKAIDILTVFIIENSQHIGLFDYLHLGVLHFETGNDSMALNLLQQQQNNNQIAEAEYYMGMIHKSLGEPEKSKYHFEKAKKLYKDQQYMFDPYTHQVDKVFLADIERELQ